MAHSKRTYDSYAAKWAERVRSGEKVMYEYLEKPAMYAELPALAGKRVLCVGCGTGEECRYLKDKGAARVVGIDISEGLIDFAKQSYPDIEFFTRAMEDINFPEASFDFVYSSLTLHYARSWTDILTRIRRALVPDGEFLFSTHHPVKWGAQKKRVGDRFSYLLGFSKWGDDGFEVHGDYLNEREIQDVWFNELHVTYWHRPLGAIMRDIRDSGFVIKDMIEPKPMDAVKGKKLNFWTVHQKIPQVMIFKLESGAGSR